MVFFGLKEGQEVKKRTSVLNNYLFPFGRYTEKLKQN
jgi:hypothetical protein